jgi:hypothetical protein
VKAIILVLTTNGIIPANLIGHKALNGGILKLMLYHTNMLNASGIGNYGMAMSMSQRRDITASYARLASEIRQYAEDVLNILIDNVWLERPPHAADRGELIKHKKS